MTAYQMMKLTFEDDNMIRLSALLLCAALPAGASTVTLDPGDQGVQWVPGVGFRAVDGSDTYGGGKAPCPVKAVYKDGAEDRVVVERECAVPDMFAAAAIAEDIFVVADESGSWPYLNPTTGISTDTSTVIPTTPETFTPTTTGFLCCDTLTTTVVVVEQPVAPVPLPGTFIALLAALTLLCGLVYVFRPIKR